MLSRFFNNRNVLGLLFMLPAGLLLLVFLTYPLGLGTWLGFTDTKVGRAGIWVGLDNYKFLWGDEVTRLALFNTLFYTFVASVIKFVLGLWLALLLNRNLPFKSFFRAVVLLPSSCRRRCRRSRSGGSTTRSSRSSAGRCSSSG
jgi:multiple sugar transport system permease protein